MFSWTYYKSLQLASGVLGVFFIVLKTCFIKYCYCIGIFADSVFIFFFLSCMFSVYVWFAQMAPSIVVFQMGCSGSRRRVRASSAICQSRTLAAVRTLRRSEHVQYEVTIHHSFYTKSISKLKVFIGSKNYSVPLSFLLIESSFPLVYRKMLISAFPSPLLLPLS